MPDPKPAPASRRWLWYLLLTALLLVSAATYGTWRILWQPNVAVSPYGAAYLYIRTGTGYAAVLDSLRRHELLRDMRTFEWLAERRGYPRLVHPGRYRLSPTLGNQDLLDMLLAGRQDTLAFTLDAFKYKPQLTRQISRQLEADSAELRRLLNNNAFLTQRYQLDTTTVLTLFLPGPYRLFWNTSARQFLDSAAATHRRFWTTKRQQRADSLGLSPTQVHVLASIVQRETAMKEDKPIIAGVYLNRLRRGMRLQADPTLLWAIGNFGVKRVLNKDKLVDSPYNTYKHKGLPPGPITSANRQSLDAVLKPAAHQYVFFCARPDGSGYSDFAETYADHKRNASRYQQRLDSLGIKR
ncbi:endolytic transglycosylase MltG [Hymenobacter sp. BT186]|uniref:Endolytic murein transglycosylase n=1 Tax=Hymenobacter telluris TaxID=2816474 RepID=A0A939EZI0_9BACT|nr:endolytic transglycosylase MltG [Hymenobacter telluris]MBO0358733.1 endolytic transglycosylase MltG [Hymenobacter telluris]MBW3374759.1 endolytic transglycosylase MltG [Hymenobacter norwichensis]